MTGSGGNPNFLHLRFQTSGGNAFTLLVLSLRRDTTPQATHKRDGGAKARREPTDQPTQPPAGDEPTGSHREGEGGEGPQGETPQTRKRKNPKPRKRETPKAPNSRKDHAKQGKLNSPHGVKNDQHIQRSQLQQRLNRCRTFVLDGDMRTALS